MIWQSLNFDVFIQNFLRLSFEIILLFKAVIFRDDDPSCRAFSTAAYYAEPGLPAFERMSLGDTPRIRLKAREKVVRSL